MSGITNTGLGGTQPVSGTVAVSSVAGTVAVSGSVTVSGTIAATQSGTWTARIVGNAGGIVDFVGQNATAPANSLLVAGEFNTTPTTITNGNASPLQLDSAGNLLVNVKTGGTSGTVAQGSTTSGQSGMLIQGAVTTNAPTYTTAQTDPLSLDTSGNLRVSVKDSPANTNKFLVTADPVTFASPQHVIMDSGSTTVTGTVAVNTSQYGGNNVVGNGVNGLATLGNYGTQNTSAAAWTAATALNTAVTLVSNLTGYSSVLITLNQAPSGTLTAGAVTFEQSNDNSNWFGVQGLQLGTTQVVGPTVSLTVATYSAILISLNAPYLRVRLSTQITGTGTLTVGYAAQALPMLQSLAGQLNFSGSLPAGTNTIGGVNVYQFGGSAVVTGTGASGVGIPRVTVSNDTQVKLWDGTDQVDITAKGTQGTNAIQTQDFKDSGRTYVVLSASLITGVTSEALATFTKNVNGTNTTSQTAYTITSGKTFRIQSLYVAIANSTTVANNCIYNVRAAGSVSASSPIVMSNAATAPVAVATSKGFFALSIPDGIDIAGNGTIQIGVSHLENVTTVSISSFTLTGYEY